MNTLASKINDLDYKQLLALTLNLFNKTASEEQSEVSVVYDEASIKSELSSDAILGHNSLNPLQEKILAAPISLKKNIIAKAVNEIITRVINLPDNIGMHDPLDQTGLDSLMAIEVRDRIGKATGLTLDVGLIYNFSTVDAIAEHLLEIINNEHSTNNEEKVEAVSAEDPIAIVGMSCRFPGGCNTIEQYWNMLLEGRDCISEMKQERWDMDAYFDEDPTKPGKMYSKWSGLLDNVKGFDAAFFGISAKEAENMDPQQRILLELAWEAIENSGYSAELLKGTKGAVFVGAVNSEYALLQSAGTDESLNGYMGTGNATSIIAGRVAYLLGFEGPTMVVDTACSSSLVSVDLACKNLRDGSADIALAGGINLNLTPKTNVILSKAMMLSPDGRCKAFDHKANGYVRSEGGGLVVLKRLSDAERDGDNIIALVQGGAVNQDGRSQGLTAPNGLAQEKILKQVLSSSGTDVNKIDYIEAHGTGTALGDPIEIHAISNVYSEKREAENKLFVGSVKSNIGHSEAAAGIASLIKCALITKHRKIPPSIHIEELNPLLNYDADKIEIVKSRKDLDQTKEVRVGVSSFGMSGTNCHIILSSYHPLEQVIPITQNSHGSPKLLTLSAKSKQGLQEVLKENLKFLESTEVDIERLCFTSNVARDHFTSRFSAQVTDKAQAISALKKIIEENDNDNDKSLKTTSDQKHLTFAFAGQGSQYVGMGKSLYENNACFRKHIDTCDDWINSSLKFSLISVLWGKDSSLINDTSYTQPAIFSLEYALAQMWLECGVLPDVLVGHSIGEITAACIAGVLNLQDALHLVSQRGMLMKKLTASGAMTVIYADKPTTDDLIADYLENISIAAINGSQNMVISGASTHMDLVLQQCELHNVAYKKLTVSRAFHSPLMAPMLNEFRDAIADVKLSSPVLPLMSCVTGQLETELFTSIDYWVDHISAPVRFFDTIHKIDSTLPGLILEIGPGTTLSGMIRSEADFSHLESTFTLNRKQIGVTQIGLALEKIYLFGVMVKWTNVYGDWQLHKVEMPNYPFQRKDYWLAQGRNLTSMELPISIEGGHPLIGQKLRCPQLTFQQALTFRTDTFFEEHMVFGLCILPGSAYVEMGYAIGEIIFGSDDFSVCELNILEPLVFSNKGQTRVIQVHITQGSNNENIYSVYSCDEELYLQNECVWLLHASGQIQLKSDNESLSIKTQPAVLTLEQLRENIVEEVDAATIYQSLNKLGLQYGPSYQGAKKVFINEEESLGFINLKGMLSNQEYFQVHPAILDSCFHQIALYLNKYQGIDSDIFVPVKFGSVDIYQKVSNEVWCYSEVTRVNNDRVLANFTLYDTEGSVVAKIIDAKFRKVSYINIVSQVRKANQDWLYRPQWHESSIKQEETELKGEKVLILSSEDTLSKKLIERLEKYNSVVVVKASSSYDATHELAFTINPKIQSHFDFMLDSLKESATLPSFILNTWPLIKIENSELIDERYTSEGLFNLTQSLVKHRIELKQLSVLTQYSQQIEDKEQVQPKGAAVWGLAKVIAAEQFELNCRKYDIDDTQDEAVVSLIIQDLVANEDEDTIAYRNGRRFVGNLDRFSFSRDKRIKAVQFTDDSTYLITGGLGALGLHIASWMISKGAKHLVLTSRRDPSPTALSQIEAMRQKGVDVIVAIADVSNRSDVAQLASDIKNTLPALRGVVHAAGVLDDGILLLQEWSRFEKVYAAKVQGSWNLHNILDNNLLDFTVYFSSAASMLGIPGQSNYAAANSYMDSLAHMRTAQGFPSTSINWGPWGEIGMSTSDAVKSRLEKENIVGMMNPVQAMLYFEQVIEVLQAGKALPQVGVMSVNWVNLSRSFKEMGIAPFFLNRLMVELDEAKNGEEVEEVNNFLMGLEQVNKEEKLDFVEGFIRLQVCKVLGGLSASEVSPTDSLFDIGMDSLMAVDLRNTLVAALGKQIPTTILFEYNTTFQLAEYLLENLQIDDNNALQGAEESNIVEFRGMVKGSKESPLFFVHAVGGSVFSYSGLSSSLNKNIPFYGIQSLENELHSGETTSIEQLATLYIEKIKEVQPEGPYRLGGWSMGGYIAFEMAKQLREEHIEIETVLMLDSVQGEVDNNKDSEKQLKSLMIFAFDLGIPPEMLDMDILSSQSLQQVISSFYRVAQENAILPESISFETFEQKFNLFNSNMNALLKYQPTAYDGKVIRIMAKDITMDTKATPWNELIPNLVLREVEGNHFTVLKKPNLMDVVKIINEALAPEH